jgi:hypothetical protein
MWVLILAEYPKLADGVRPGLTEDHIFKIQVNGKLQLIRMLEKRKTLYMRNDAKQ